MKTLVGIFLLHVLLASLMIAEVQTQCSKPSLSTNSASNGVVNGSTLAGNSIVFYCTHEYGGTVFNWFFNESTYPGNYFFLVLLNPVPGGTVQCSVDGCNEVSDPIHVITPPIIDVEASNVTTKEGESFSLTCNFQGGYPYPNITWYHDNKVIGYGADLTVEESKVENSGEYTCLASNEAGYRKAAIWITIVSNASSSPLSSNVSSSPLSSSVMAPNPSPAVTTDYQFISTISSAASTLGETSTPTTPDNQSQTGQAVLILAICVAVFSLSMLTLINKMRARAAGNDKRIPLSPSCVNSTFREDDDEEEANPERKHVNFETDFVGGDPSSKGSYGAHIYEEVTTDIFDTSGGNSVSKSHHKENPIHVDHSPHDVGTVKSAASGPINSIYEVTMTEEDDIDNEEERSDHPPKPPPRDVSNVNAPTSLKSKGYGVETNEHQDDLQISETRNPKWLELKRKANRSRVLTGVGIVNFVHKLDLKLAKEGANHPLREEFKSVPYKIPSPHEWPLEAMSRNRYRDITPTPKTCVRLSNTGEPISTYINANYIKGFDGYGKTYISAQAPTYDTVPDFWRMIWENDIEAIVMLTGIIEGGKNKCSKYWPSVEESTRSYGKFTVQTVHEEATDNYKVTFLSVSMMNDPSIERDVYHFSFLGWPDFGVPNDGYAMLQLRNAVEAMRNTEKTLLVHCSAGIGRSGTYIGIDIGINQYEEENVVDPLLILDLLREDRGGMIQTLEQYEFMHRVLSSHIVQNL